MLDTMLGGSKFHVWEKASCFQIFAECLIYMN